MDADECLLGHTAGCESRPAAITRRKLLSMVALAAVGLRWSQSATAQCRDTGIDPRLASQPADGRPYRDLRPGLDQVGTDSNCAIPITPRRGNSTRPRRIVIEEFFTYDCGLCSALEAGLSDWQRALPNDVPVVRVPTTFTAVARLHARAFYAATRLGKVDQLHRAFYAAVQPGGERLDSVEALAAVFASFGVEREAFENELNSVEVYIEVDRAAALSRRYGVTTAPALVVGGRYLTTPEIAGSSEAMLAAAADRVQALGSQR